MNTTLHRARQATLSALKPALKTAWWITKMTLPISLGLSILDYLGVIDTLSRWFTPLFELIGLPGEAALVFITGATSSIYAAVAVIATLGFDYRSVVILALMILISHNLIIESIIQKRTGSSPWRIVPLRIGMSFLCALLLNWILPTELSGRLFLPEVNNAPESWSALLLSWIRTIIPLLIKMGIIIVSLNIIQSLLREFKIMNLLAVPLRPFMDVAGLPRSTSFLWIICNVIGLTYGSAALIDELERGGVSTQDARLLNTHVAISHSLLEDTAIFTSIGIGLFWLVIPRLILAFVAVWITRLIWHLQRTK